MSESRLHPSVDIATADWLRPRLRRFGSAVAAVVPDGFPAYIRICHPARGADDAPVSWAAVAARSGRTMHRQAQFHAISRPLAMALRDPSPWDRANPPEGNLPPALLRALCATLAVHTDTPACCWFCLWDGYGWLHGSPAVTRLTICDDDRPVLPPQPVPPALSLEVLHGPRVHLPHRDYILFEGVLEAAPELGYAIGDTVFPQSPNLFWPQDHAWCVASEIDLFCTLVAGSESLAAALLTDPRLDVWRIDPEDSIAFDGDQINT